MLQIQLQQHTNIQKTRKDKTGEQLRGREGGGLDGSFLKIENSALILEKKAVILSIFEFDFLFKV